MLLCGAALLPGCASIVSPSTHQLNVETTPAGAICDVTRNNEALGTISPTPGRVTVSRASGALLVTCRHPQAPAGAPAGQATVEAGLNPWFFGNILFGGLIGIIVDASTGAIARYPDGVTVPMPAASVPPFAPEPVAETPSQPPGRPISALPGTSPLG